MTIIAEVQGKDSTTSQSKRSKKAAITPKQGERWPKFTNEQIRKNLDRMEGGNGR